MVGVILLATAVAVFFLLRNKAPKTDEEPIKQSVIQLDHQQTIAFRQ